MKKFILSFLFAVILSFPSMAMDRNEATGVVGKRDVEDPHYLEKFRNTYPQTFPEYTGQVVGTCMCPLGIPERAKINRFYKPTIICCVGGGELGLIGSCLDAGLCPYATLSSASCHYISGICCCAGSVVPAVCTCAHLAKCAYGYAERSGRKQLTQRADFARLCLLEDPLSGPACYLRVRNCCIPLGNACSTMKESCGDRLYDCLTPGITTLSKTVWDCCLGSCIRLFCGSGTADEKQDI